MARTTQRQIDVDGTSHQIAKLTIGIMRELDEDLDACTTAYEKLRVKVKAIHTAMKRAKPELAITVEELEKLLDEEDLARAHAAVLLLTTGREPAAPGESASP